MTDEQNLTPQDRAERDAAKSYNDEAAAFMLLANAIGHGYKPTKFHSTASHTNGRPAQKKLKNARVVWPASKGTYVKPKD